MHYSSVLPVLALCAASAQASNPKRGLLSDVAAETAQKDIAQLTSNRVTKVSWYYSFGHYPDAEFSKKYKFTMQQFGVDRTADANGNNFKNLNTLMEEVDKTRPGTLFTFLEPAISGISVQQAIDAWRQYIQPIQKKYPKMRVGSPSVINGDASLPWINEFTSKCPDCKFDFLDVHYYWVYNEFKNFIQTWHKRFPNKPMQVADIGFESYPKTGPECKFGDKKCVQRIKDMITWMDGVDYITRYTFRGEFRRTQGQPHQPLWSFLDDNGNYTPLGKWYLGVK